MKYHIFYHIFNTRVHHKESFLSLFFRENEDEIGTKICPFLQVVIGMRDHLAVQTDHELSSKT